MDDKRIEQLFAEALEHEPPERQAFLDDVCVDDLEIKAEVEAFLAHYESGVDRGFLEPVPIHLLPSARPKEDIDSFVGRQIGPFTVQKRIGTGGMGNVYLAVRSNDFDQCVAIKVIKHGLETGEMERRFHHEARVLASLSAHPNIAALFDAGRTDEGMPYLVLEYVEGQPIDQYCDEHRLSARERLKLFRIVCDTVQFAHRHTVVHRDLKPSNILISPDGIPKLIDFGIAKLLDPQFNTESDELLTDTGYRALTPDYASPEQISGGSISTATDVYSLGVVLYELLVGRRPFQLTKRSLAETERIICERQPPKPSSMVIRPETTNAHDHESATTSTSDVGDRRQVLRRRLARTLTGDLDTIVLKALEKQPELRYTSANALSADIGRYLRGEPIQARPINVVQRSWRWLRRNPRVGGLTVALLTLILITAIVSPLVALRFQQQRDEVTAQKTRAERAEQQAKREAEAAVKLSDFAITIIAPPDPLGSMMAGARSESISSESSRLDKIEREIQTLADQPETQAKTLQRLGRVYLGLARSKDALRVFERAQQIRETVLDPGHEDIAVGSLDLARVFIQQGQWSWAHSEVSKALSILQNGSHDDHPLLWPTMLLLARLETDSTPEENPNAMRLYREALTLMTRRWKEDRADHTQLVEGWADMLTLIYTRDYPYSRGIRNATPLLFEFLFTIANYQGDEDPIALLQSIQQFFTHFIVGDEDNAIDVGRQTLSRTQRMFGEQHKMTAIATFMLAVAIYRTDDYDETETLLRESLAITHAVVGERHYYVVPIEYFLGHLYAEQGKTDLSEIHFRRAVAIGNKTLRDVHPELLVHSMTGLVTALRKMGRTDEASQIERQAHLLFAITIRRGVGVFRDRDRKAEAQELLDAAENFYPYDYVVFDDGVPRLDVYDFTKLIRQAEMAYSDDDGTRLDALVREIEQRFSHEEMHRMANHLRRLMNPPSPRIASELPADVTTVPVSELQFATASVGQREPPMRDQVPIDLGRTCLLRVEGNFFDRGLYAHAPSKYVVRLSGKWQHFRTKYGIQDGHAGTVTFVVRADGEELFRSAVIKDDKIRQLDLDVSNATSLELIAETAEDGFSHDWAVWLNPQLER